MAMTSTPPRFRQGRVLLAPLRWLERSRGRRRRLLIALYVLLGVIAGVLTWRATSLNALPDAGDPFDVEAFVAASRVPEADDAFAFYRRAAEALALTPEADSWNMMGRSGPPTWAEATPAVRDWAAANREALALWRAGTERPAGLPEPLDRIAALESSILPGQVTRLTNAAMLEGLRLEAAGDRVGALGWFGAIVRSGRHLRAKSRLSWRWQALYAEAQVRDILMAWSRDPAVDARSLRAGLALIRDADRPAPLSENLKAEFVALMHALDDPVRLHRNVERQSTMAYPYDDFRSPIRFYWFLKREPERGRRVARLMFANWLAQCDRPMARRPKLVGNSPEYSVWSLYEADPSAPEAARAIAPAALFAWLESTALLWRVMPSYQSTYAAFDAESQRRAVAMVTLAEAIYLRENGRPSPSLESLVPGILDAIPEPYRDTVTGPKP